MKRIIKETPVINCVVCGARESFWDKKEMIDIRGKDFADEAEAEAYIKEHTPKTSPEFSQELYFEGNRHLQAFYCSEECKAKLPASLDGVNEDLYTVLADFNEREDKDF